MPGNLCFSEDDFSEGVFSDGVFSEGIFSLSNIFTSVVIKLFVTTGRLMSSESEAINPLSSRRSGTLAMPVLEL